MFWSVGSSPAVRTLNIGNCGQSGGPTALLSDPGRSSYQFDYVSITSYGGLAVLPVSVPLSQYSTTSITSLTGDTTSRMVVNAITTLVLPGTYTLPSIQLYVYGQLGGVSNLTVSSGGSLVLEPAGLTVGATAGSYVWNNLTFVGGSSLVATTISSLNVNTTLSFNDTSSATLSSLAGLVVLVNQFYLSPVATVTFTGYWTLNALSYIALASGSVVSGNAGGWWPCASTRACVCACVCDRRVCLLIAISLLFAHPYVFFAVP